MSFVANTVIKHGHENGKIVFYQPGDTVPSEVAKGLAETGAVSVVGSKQETTTAKEEKTEPAKEEKQEEKTEPAKTEEKTEENAESEELKKRLSLPKGEAK